MASDLPYLTISIDDKTLPTTKPFKTVLHNPNSKKGAKSQWNTFLYIFKCKMQDDTWMWKVGQAYTDKTYNSKNRFCPWIEYVGQFQILHEGHALELLMKKYIKQAAGQSYKGNTEWFANADKAFATVLKALDANDLFKEEKSRTMVNVLPFPIAFTCGHGANVDAYLSLFRVKYRGHLYKLTRENADKTLNEIAVEQYREKEVAKTKEKHDDDEK